MSAPAAQELAAARVLAVSGLTSSAVTVSLRAAVQAAETALMLLDRVPPAGQAALVAEFVAVVVRERGLDPAVGRALRLLLNRQQLAEVTAPPQAEAEAAIADATLVTEAVAEWREVAQRVARDRRSASLYR
jgi:hypothetical protein